ncbi:MAG: hypothetical protein J6U66_02350, partial [Lachnospiraceae bacterium]|nr:hypothetical protein [Lachnospiraceae bacterium]
DLELYEGCKSCEEGRKGKVSYEKVCQPWGGHTFFDVWESLVLQGFFAFPQWAFEGGIRQMDEKRRIVFRLLTYGL